MWSLKLLQGICYVREIYKYFREFWYFFAMSGKSDTFHWHHFLPLCHNLFCELLWLKGQRSSRVWMFQTCWCNASSLLGLIVWLMGRLVVIFMYLVHVIILVLDDTYNELCQGERDICQGNPSSRFGRHPDLLSQVHKFIFLPNNAKNRASWKPLMNALATQKLRVLRRCPNSNLHVLCDWCWTL